LVAQEFQEQLAQLELLKQQALLALELVPVQLEQKRLAQELIPY
jgi:hypothetical protein